MFLSLIFILVDRRLGETSSWNEGLVELQDCFCWITSWVKHWTKHNNGGATISSIFLEQTSIIMIIAEGALPFSLCVWKGKCCLVVWSALRGPESHHTNAVQSPFSYQHCNNILLIIEHVPQLLLNRGYVWIDIDILNHSRYCIFIVWHIWKDMWSCLCVFVCVGVCVWMHAVYKYMDVIHSN